MCINNVQSQSELIGLRAEKSHRDLLCRELLVLFPALAELLLAVVFVALVSHWHIGTHTLFRVLTEELLETSL